MTKHQLPTGYLIIDDYERGQLETLSIGDYGKASNIKADFLGYTRPIHGVECKPCMPLTEKWVVTVSTQYGCPMKCTFCDVPNILFRGNVSEEDLWRQLIAAIGCFPSVHYTDRLNLHFARMGEPVFNPAVFAFARQLGTTAGRTKLFEQTGLRVENLHPVLTTSLPRKLRDIGNRLQEWCRIKSEFYNGAAGLQLSINSTDDEQRDKMFRGLSLDIRAIAEIARELPSPIGRKYCLNFALAADSKVDAALLSELFDSRHWMVKITPIHNNNACRSNGLETPGGYSSYEFYAPVEESLKSAGFDVIFFVPSQDEEDGLVTCGNAVLGGSRLRDGLGALNIEGVP